MNAIPCRIPASKSTPFQRSAVNSLARGPVLASSSVMVLPGFCKCPMRAMACTFLAFCLTYFMVDRTDIDSVSANDLLSGIQRPVVTLLTMRRNHATISLQLCQRLPVTRLKETYEFGRQEIVPPQIGRPYEQVVRYHKAHE
jgi:hypothetical protein